MEQVHDIQINPEILTKNKSTKEYRIVKSKRGINFKYYTGGKNPFNIMIKKKKDGGYKYSTQTNVNELTTSKEMIALQKQREAFFSKKLRINDMEFFKNDKKYTYDDKFINIKVKNDANKAKESLRFWKNIKTVEEKIGREFNLKLPLSIEDEKMLNKLIKSIINNDWYDACDINSMDIKIKSANNKGDIYNFINRNVLVYEVSFNKDILGAVVDEIYDVYLIKVDKIKIVNRKSEGIFRIYTREKVKTKFLLGNNIDEYDNKHMVIECKILDIG